MNVNGFRLRFDKCEIRQKQIKRMRTTLTQIENSGVSKYQSTSNPRKRGLKKIEKNIIPLVSCST